MNRRPCYKESFIFYLRLGNGVFNFLILWFLYLDEYHFDVTIVNRYGKNILVLLNHPEYNRVIVPAGRNFSIKTIFPDPKRIYFLAFEEGSNIRLKINDKDQEFVTATLDALSHVLYVERGRLFIFCKVSLLFLSCCKLVLAFVFNFLSCIEQ